MTQKAVISNRIYFRPQDEDERAHIIKSLTYKIEGKSSNPKAKFKPIEVIRNYKVLPQGLISVPQGRTDLLPEDVEVVDKRVHNSVPFPTPKYPLYPDQQVVYDEVSDSCFINAKVGWGKTFTALHLAVKLGQKTLVITHTVMLRDQWIDEIRSLFDMEPGIIGSDIVDIEDHCIVVGNVQTVTKMLPTLSKEFGTVILDEAHHVPADTFASLIDGLYCRYRIALSGTMLRKDGKHIVFKDYFGDHIIRPPQSNTINPKVKIVNSGIRLPAGVPWAKKVNALLYDEDYQAFIAAMALKYIDRGHRVLIVAERVEFLVKLQELIGETCILITGKTGGTGKADYEERKRLIEQVNSGEKMCIAGSKQIFSEGISVNILSLLILASPSSNEIFLEQVIGRIMRQHPDKLMPEVIDINYASASEKKQDAARLAFYIKQGWEIQKI